MSTNITPDHKTTDLGAIFSGQEYPKKTFPVYLNHNVGYLLHQANVAVGEAERSLTLAENSEEVSDLAPFTKAVEEARSGYDEALAAVKEHEYTVTIQAQPRAVRKDLWDKANATHKPETNVLGNEKTNPKALEQYNDFSWALHVIDFVAPDGETRVKFDNEHQAAYFRGNAPDVAIQRLQNEIDALYDEETSGFEAAVKDIDFLSDASPEA